MKILNGCFPYQKVAEECCLLAGSLVAYSNWEGVYEREVFIKLHRIVLPNLVVTKLDVSCVDVSSVTERASELKATEELLW